VLAVSVALGVGVRRQIAAVFFTHTLRRRLFASWYTAHVSRQSAELKQIRCDIIAAAERLAPLGAVAELGPGARVCVCSSI
jgi:hypothetical protein